VNVFSLIREVETRGNAEVDFLGSSSGESVGGFVARVTGVAFGPLEAQRSQFQRSGICAMGAFLTVH
jgi:hypothetical protein